MRSKLSRFLFITFLVTAIIVMFSLPGTVSATGFDPVGGIALTKTVDPTVAVIGTETVFTYTFTVTNTGNCELKDVKIEDHGFADINIGTMPAGAVVIQTTTVTKTPDAFGEMKNEATAKGKYCDKWHNWRWER